ncbi:Fic family protein [Cellulomonas soli]|uniref:Fic family protein n=1 Tax=Cellulomonas soli TaxID=931535 RepID=UPI003F839564
MTQPDPLAPLVDLPGVADAVAQARQACEELRWHEGYRRRWREVRAEATVRCAQASAALDGARLPVEAVRALAVGLSDGALLGATGHVGADRPDAVGAVVLGALRAGAGVELLMPALGGRDRAVPLPWAQVLTRLHTAAVGGRLDADLVGRVRPAGVAPTDLRGLGTAPEGEEVPARLELLGRTVAATSAPALVVAAVAHGELLALRPFAAGNGVVARAVGRLLVTSRGLDPTGSLVLERAWAQQPNLYLSAAAQFATGTPEGVGAWLLTCAQAVVGGVAEARAVADAVLAGRLA